MLSALCLLSIASSTAADSIRRLDFKNFLYPWNERMGGVPSEWKWMGPSDSKVRLVNSRHSFSEPGLPKNGTPYLMLVSVAYGDLDGDGMDEAA